MSSLKKKILLVDDEAIQRQLLSNLLQSVPHYQVIESDSGLSALETLKEEQVDLIILDVRMPVMDGFETLTAIREDAELSHIPVIMCTAVSEREEVMRILKQGVADYIVKPINKQTILPKVQQVLGIVDDASDGTVASESHHTQFTADTYLALIADEDENFRKIARTILSTYYDIIEASTESSVKRLSLDKQPQVILLGRLSGTLNIESTFSKLRPLIQGEKTKVYRVFSTAVEALRERRLKYHGRMIRTLDENLLRSRLQEMMVLPDFDVFFQELVVVVVLKNYYPQTDDESRIVMQAIAMALGSNTQTVRFDLSDWESESMDKFEIASRYIEDIITEFKSFGILIEITGYTPPEGSSLAALLADQLSILRQYIDYLTSQIAKLQQYCKVQDVETITSVGQNLNSFGKEHGFPQISFLADMLIQESNNNHWNVVESLIQQLSLEQKKIAKDSAND